MDENISVENMSAATSASQSAAPGAAQPTSAPGPATGAAPTPGAPAPSMALAGTAPLSPAEERTWAMMAHLSVWLNLVTGFLGVGAALLIYLLYRDRSRYVAYQAMQSFLMQLLFWAGGGALIGVVWAITGALCAILIGILLIPIALILTFLLLIFPLIALAYGAIGAVECSNGSDFRYWLVGNIALNLI